MMCPKCGGLIPQPGVVYGWSGPWCFGHPDQIVYNSPPIIKECEHCFCQEEIVFQEGFKVGKKHKKCCMCGTRREI
jgi:hypothetical protein